MTAPTDPLEILIWSNPPWSPTGYGQQCAQLVMSFSELGHNVDVAMTFGMFGGSVPLPTGGTAFGMGYKPPFGEDRLATIMCAKPYDLVLTLGNTWAMDAQLWAKLRELGGFELLAYDPVERWPVTPGQRKFYETTDARLVPFTEWSAEAAGEAHIDVTGVVPHTIPAEFTDDGAAPREMFGLAADRPVLGMVGANAGAKQGWLRKGFETVLLAYRELREHPDYGDAVLWWHTCASDAQSGTDLLCLIDACGLPRESVMFTPPQLQYAPLDAAGLAAAYRCMDVLLNPSKAEGFGVPVIEAQACGTPVITTGTCSQPEIVTLGSLLWDSNPMWDATQLGFVDVPDPSEVCQKVVHWLGSPVSESRMAKEAAQVRHQFSRARVRDECWQPILAEVGKASPDWSGVSV